MYFPERLEDTPFTFLKAYAWQKNDMLSKSLYSVGCAKLYFKSEVTLNNKKKIQFCSHAAGYRNATVSLLTWQY